MRFLLFILIILAQLCLNAQSFEWAINVPNASFNKKSIDEDAASNLYVTGKFSGNITLGNAALSSSKESSFITKIDPSGRYIWAKAISCNVKDIAVSNEIFIAGNFSDTLKIDQVTLISAGAEDAFLAKFDLMGMLLWIKQGKGAGSDNFNSITINTAGDLIAAGTSSNDMMLDNNSFSSGAYVIIFDASGNIKTKIEVANNCDAWEVQFDGLKNIYLLCGFRDSVNLGGTTFHQYGMGEHLLAKYNGNGVLEWAKDLGTTYYYPYTNLRVTKGGDFYLSKDNRYSSIELSKFTSSGDVTWSKKFGGSTYDNCADMELDDEENVYLTGGFWYQANYGGAAVSGQGNCLYFAKIDSSGSGTWAKSASGSANSYVYGQEISFKKGSHGYLIGQANGTSSLDSHPVSGWFIAKLSYNIAASIQTLSQNDDSINVYPSPSNGLINIDLSALSVCNKNIFIYDILGRCIYQKLNVSGSNLSVDLSGCSTGVLSIEIIADRKRWLKKVLVE